MSYSKRKTAFRKLHLHCTSGESVGRHLLSFKEIRYKSVEYNHAFMIDIFAGLKNTA